MSDRDLAFTPAHQLSEMVTRKAVSPVELTELYLRRIEDLDPKLNAFLTVTGDEAMAAARSAEQAAAEGGELGPLHGIPISVKDLETTAGVRTTFGSLIFEDHVPDSDSGTVERVRASGAIMLGKTNTPEFGMRGTTENRLGDACRNPWDTARTPGGSSGGATAALAAGLCPLATASDAGGSVRIPGSFTGVYGIKPTLGRAPRFGGVARPAPNPVAQPGPMARTVRDTAMLLQVMAGPHDRDANMLRQPPPDFLDGLDSGVKGLRIAWSPDLGYATVDPEVARVTAEAARVFEELGASVDEPGVAMEQPFGRMGAIVSANAYASYGHHLEERAGDLTDYARSRLEKGKQITGVEYAMALRELELLKFQMATLLETYDLLMTPTMAVPAFEIGRHPTEIAGRAVERDWGFNPFNVVFNLTGQPAASVPCGFSSGGLPIGLQIVGRLWDEATVLRASAAFEQARPWADKLPPVS
jgi:aspartyl-tRNA(Asn)/glutamyl-tRNA(Gln) amidotransferase subunit A